MAIVNVELGNIPDSTILDKGEYEVRVVGEPVVRTSKKGNNYINVALQAVAHPTSETVYHIITLPNQGEDEKQNLRRRRDLRDLCACFGVEHANGDLDLDVFEGKAGFVFLGIEESVDNYPKKNRVSNMLPSR